MRLFFLALVAATNPAFADFDEAATKSRCQAEWGEDFQMINYCLGQQRTAARSIKALEATLDPAMQDRLSACRAEWMPDHALTEYCIKQQIEARQRLSYITATVPDHVAGLIHKTCTSQWGEDFAMLAYCSEQQVSAWRKLNK